MSAEPGTSSPAKRGRGTTRRVVEGAAAASRSGASRGLCFALRRDKERFEPKRHARGGEQPPPPPSAVPLPRFAGEDVPDMNALARLAAAARARGRTGRARGDLGRRRRRHADHLPRARALELRRARRLRRARSPLAPPRRDRPRRCRVRHRQTIRHHRRRPPRRARDPRRARHRRAGSRPGRAASSMRSAHRSTRPARSRSGPCACRSTPSRRRRLERGRVKEPLKSGVRVIDIFAPLCQRPAHRHLRRLRRRQVDSARHDGGVQRVRCRRHRARRRARPRGPRVSGRRARRQPQVRRHRGGDRRREPDDAARWRH